MKALKKGNIYKIIHSTEVRYFQYFYSDPHNMGGNIIWVLGCNYETNNLEEIVQSGYKLYMYTMISVGINLKFWQLIGNMPIPQDMEYYPTFRHEDGITNDWYIRQFDNKINVGKTLTEEQKKLPNDLLFFPERAVNAMIEGKMTFGANWG